MKREIVTILSLLFIMTTMSSELCSKTTPARDIEGNWTTPFAVTVYYYSDICGSYVKVAKAQVNMRWEVFSTNDPNVVSIDIYRTSSTTPQKLASPGCDLYLPMTTLLTVRGDISSSQLTLSSSGTTVGVFNFTSNNLTGTFNSSFDYFCGVYCTGVGSDPQGITLTK